MVWIFVLLVSFVALCVKVSVLLGERKYKSRRGLTGAEVARSVLDAGGFSQMTVDRCQDPSSASQPHVHQLRLPRPVYEGKTLVALADAAKEGVARVKSRGLFMGINLKGGLWTFVIGAGWIVFLLGLILSSPAFRIFGEAVLTVVFLLAVIKLPEEWEDSEHTLFLLRHTQYFDADELARLRRILRSQSFGLAAQIFRPVERLLQLSPYVAQVSTTNRGGSAKPYGGKPARQIKKDVDE